MGVDDDVHDDDDEEEPLVVVLLLACRVGRSEVVSPDDAADVAMVKLCTRLRLCERGARER